MEINSLPKGFESCKLSFYLFSVDLTPNIMGCHKLSLHDEKSLYTSQADCLVAAPGTEY